LAGSLAFHPVGQICLPNYHNSVDFHPHKAPQTQREIDLILFPWRTIRKHPDCKAGVCYHSGQAWYLTI
jgi:hypothetical protein